MNNKKKINKGSHHLLYLHRLLGNFIEAPFLHKARYNMITAADAHRNLKTLKLFFKHLQGTFTLDPNRLEKLVIESTCSKYFTFVNQ